jgi:hypothetical protein
MIISVALCMLAQKTVKGVRRPQTGLVPPLGQSRVMERQSEVFHSSSHLRLVSQPRAQPLGRGAGYQH